MDKILVSIIIPTYNRYTYLGETLNSVLEQTYDNWECIVIDDGSTDYTNELLDYFCELDSRIKYLSRPIELPKGANVCRNYGLKLSKGKFIQWLDSDDVVSKNKLQEQIKVLETNNSDLATCKWGKLIENQENFLFENLSVYRNFYSPKDFLESLSDDHGYFPIHAYLMSKKLILRSGGWLKTLKVNQDGEFMIRVLLSSNSIYFAKKAHVYYRKSKSNQATSNIDKRQFNNLIESWILIEKHINEFFPNSELRYLKNAKRRIYIRYRDSKGYIKPYKSFFKSDIKEEPSDFKLAFYRMITRYRWSTILLRFCKNLVRGKISIER